MYFISYIELTELSALYTTIDILLSSAGTAFSLFKCDEEILKWLNEKNLSGIIKGIDQKEDKIRLTIKDNETLKELETPRLDIDIPIKQNVK